MRWFFEWLERRRLCAVCAQLREELGRTVEQARSELDRTRDERDWFRDKLLEKQLGQSPSTPETDPNPSPEMVASTFEQLVRADEQAEIEERAQQAAKNPLIYEEYATAAQYDPAYTPILELADELKKNG